MTVRGPRATRRPWYADMRIGGALILVIAAALMYVSYTAQNGLPWQDTYDVRIAVPDAGKLIKNTDVKVGGARVGQVLAIEAVPRRGDVPPHAVLDVQVQEDAGPLAVDSTAEVRLASVLGGKYVELVPGKARRTLPEGGTLPLENSGTTVEIEDALAVFDPEGRAALQRVIASLGDALAGRGGDLNETIGTTAPMLPRLQAVLSNLSAEETRLGAFVRGAAAATTALEPVATELGPLVRASGDTLGALDAAGPSLGESIEEFPPAARATRRALRRLNPVLDDTVAVSRELQPAAAVLAPSARGLSGVAATAIRLDPQLGRMARPVDRLLGGVDAFSRNPDTSRALRLLGSTDLATFGASATLGLGALLETTWQAEQHCRVTSTWIRRLVDITSDGNAGGNWVRMAPLDEPTQMVPQARPSANLHANPYPNTDARECEAGNEGFAPGQMIGNPPGLQGGRSGP